MTKRAELVERLRTAQVAGEAFHVEPEEVSALARALTGLPDQPEVSPEVTKASEPICRWRTVEELCDPGRGHIQIVGYFETLTIAVDGETVRVRPGERLVDPEGPVHVLHSFGATGPRPPVPEDGGPAIESVGVVWIESPAGLELRPLPWLCESLRAGRLSLFRHALAELDPKVGERIRVTPQWQHDPGSWGGAVPIGAVGVVARKGEDPARGAYVELLFREVRDGLVAMSFEDFAAEVRRGAIDRETLQAEG